MTPASSRDMTFEGGPQPWVLDGSRYYQNLQPERDDTVIVQPVKKFEGQSKCVQFGVFVCLIPNFQPQITIVSFFVVCCVMYTGKVLLCQLTCQSADIMSSLCGVGVRVRVNNFFSKTTRPRDMLFFFKRYLIYRG